MEETTVPECTFTVEFSQEDGEYLARASAYPSLSYLAETPEAALRGIRNAVQEAEKDDGSTGAPESGLTITSADLRDVLARTGFGMGQVDTSYRCQPWRSCLGLRVTLEQYTDFVVTAARVWAEEGRDELVDELLRPGMHQVMEGYVFFFPGLNVRD